MTTEWTDVFTTENYTMALGKLDISHNINITDIRLENTLELKYTFHSRRAECLFNKQKMYFHF